MSSSNKNQFPDFFTTKGPISTTITPLQFAKRTYYQASVFSGQEEEYDISARPTLKPYTDNDDEMDCRDMEDNYDITLNKAGKFFTSFYVPASILPCIIGAKGAKLKALQRNTNTLIKIPRINETGNIIITGDTERKVASARTLISLTVAQRRDKIRSTHFIGLPINSDVITQNFVRFRDEILQDPPFGVTEEVFQHPIKFHLTVAVVRLLDEEELKLAKKTLQDCYNEHILKVFQGKGIDIKVKGVDIMNDDPTRVRVLYGKILMDEIVSEKAEKMTASVVSCLCQAGFAKKEYDKVRLHLTLMNSTFLDDSNASFDASSILEKYKEFEFGATKLEEIQICIHGTTKCDDGEKKYYDVVLSLPI